MSPPSKGPARNPCAFFIPLNFEFCPPSLHFFFFFAPEYPFCPLKCSEPINSVEQNTMHWLPMPGEDSNYMEDIKAIHNANHQE